MRRGIFDYLTWAAILAGAACLALQRFSDQYDGAAMFGVLLMFLGIIFGIVAFATRGQRSR